MDASYVMGLDLGPPGEPTGFAVLEWPATDDPTPESEYHLRHLERFQPGTSYQAIVGRQLNLDFVNLGFSGNGKGEPAVADMVAEIDASAFVVDFSQNNPTIESLREVYEPFLIALRTKHPKTPIIAITAIAASRETPRLDQMRQHVRDVVRRRTSDGGSLTPRKMAGQCTPRPARHASDRIEV